MQHTDPTLDKIFFALSDSTRRGMLARLCEGATSIGELGAPYAISSPAISRHIRVLEGAGLIRREVAGRVHTCALTRTGLRSAEDWLNFHRQFWETRLDALEALVLENTTGRKEQQKK